MDLQSDDRELARENLAEVLRRAVRAAPDVQLLLALAVGIGACAAMLSLRPWGWRTLFSAGAALAALAAWGMLDRERRDQREDAEKSGISSVLLRLASAAVGLIGWIALVALVFSVAGFAIGYWKS